MIKKMKNLLKIGSPKVNLILDNNETLPGQKVSGSIHLQGGWIKQKTVRLECDLVKEHPGKKLQFVAPAKTILMSNIVEKREKREIPFSYWMPDGLSPSSTNISYRLQTKLVFTNDSKSIDDDEIIVLP